MLGHDRDTELEGGSVDAERGEKPRLAARSKDNGQPDSRQQKRHRRRHGSDTSGSRRKERRAQRTKDQAEARRNGSYDNNEDDEVIVVEEAKAETSRIFHKGKGIYKRRQPKEQPHGTLTVDTRALKPQRSNPMSDPNINLRAYMGGNDTGADISFRAGRIEDYIYQQSRLVEEAPRNVKTFGSGRGGEMGSVGQYVDPITGINPILDDTALSVEEIERTATLIPRDEFLNWNQGKGEAIWPSKVITTGAGEHRAGNMDPVGVGSLALHNALEAAKRVAIEEAQNPNSMLFTSKRKDNDKENVDPHRMEKDDDPDVMVLDSGNRDMTGTSKKNPENSLLFADIKSKAPKIKRVKELKRLAQSRSPSISPSSSLSTGPSDILSDTKITGDQKKINKRAKLSNEEAYSGPTTRGRSKTRKQSVKRNEKTPSAHPTKRKSSRTTKSKRESQGQSTLRTAYSTTESSEVDTHDETESDIPPVGPDKNNKRRNHTDSDSSSSSSGYHHSTSRRVSQKDKSERRPKKESKSSKKGNKSSNKDRRGDRKGNQTGKLKKHVHQEPTSTELSPLSAGSFDSDTDTLMLTPRALERRHNEKRRKSRHKLETKPKIKVYIKDKSKKTNKKGQKIGKAGVIGSSQDVTETLHMGSQFKSKSINNRQSRITIDTTGLNKGRKITSGYKEGHRTMLGLFNKGKKSDKLDKITGSHLSAKIGNLVFDESEFFGEDNSQKAIHTKRNKRKELPNSVLKHMNPWTNPTNSPSQSNIQGGSAPIRNNRLMNISQYFDSQKSNNPLLNNASQESDHEVPISQDDMINMDMGENIPPAEMEEGRDKVMERANMLEELMSQNRGPQGDEQDNIELSAGVSDNHEDMLNQFIVHPKTYKPGDISRLLDEDYIEEEENEVDEREVESNTDRNAMYERPHYADLNLSDSNRSSSNVARSVPSKFVNNSFWTDSSARINEDIILEEETLSKFHHAPPSMIIPTANPSTSSYIRHMTPEVVYAPSNYNGEQDYDYVDYGYGKRNHFDNTRDEISDYYEDDGYEYDYDYPQGRHYEREYRYFPQPHGPYEYAEPRYVHRSVGSVYSSEGSARVVRPSHRRPVMRRRHAPVYIMVDPRKHRRPGGNSYVRVVSDRRPVEPAQSNRWPSRQN